MEKISQKEMDKRVKRLLSYVNKKGWLKVAAFCGYDDIAPCKRWADRKSIPAYVWNKLDKLLKGEADVEISIK